MAEIASAFVSIAPSAKGFGSKLDGQISGDVTSAGKRAGARFGAALKVGLLAGGVAVGAFLKGAIGEAREAQKVGALTNAVIKSTGGIANVTAKDVDRLATSISLKTGVDDEAIAAGENMLLTFGNVRNELGKGNDIFNQATIAATDLAAAFGGDAVSNSKMLGKALNDPTAGVSALTRVGVSFTAQQKEQIKTLQASGNVLGAQKIILGEVSKQTAGAAESQATASDKFRTAFANLQESIGTLLLPVLDRVLTALAQFAIFLTNNVGPGIAAVNGFLAPLVSRVSEFAQGLFAAAGGTSSFRAGLAVAAPVLQTMANTFQAVLLPAIISLGQYLQSRLVPVFQQVAAIITGRVIPIAAALATFFYGTLYPAIIGIAVVVAGKLKPVFDQLVATFRGRVLPTLNSLLGMLQKNGPAIKQVALQVVTFVGKLLALAATILGKVLPPLVRLAGFIISSVVPVIGTLIVTVVKIIGKIATFGSALIDAVTSAGKFLSGVREKIGAALDFIGDIPGKVKAFFTGAGTMLLHAGEQLMSGLKLGIETKITDAINAVKGGLDKIKGLLPGSPIKWGPLKNWNNGGAGKRLMALVAEGITKATPKTVAAAKDAFEKIHDQLESRRDALRSTLDGLKGDFASLADSVKNAFTGNLFDVSATAAVEATFEKLNGIMVKTKDAVAAATTGENFIAGLTAKKAELTGLLSSFKTLQGWGLDPKFLSQLFASGNGALITELAGMGQAGAVGAASLFGEVSDLGTQLGTKVAENDPVSDRIDETNRLLTVVNDQLSYLGSDIGKQLNQSAAIARRRSKAKKGDK